MRIALVGPTHPFRGGIAHYTTLLCRALRKRHDVRFFSLNRQYPERLFPGKTQLDSSTSPLTVENEAMLDSLDPLTWVRTACEIRRDRPDLLLFSWWHPFFGPAFGTVAHLSRRLHGIPTCFLCHNVMPHEPTVVDRMLLRYALNGGTSFIAHSQQDVANLRALLPGARVHHSPHPTYEVFAAQQAVAPAEARAQLGVEGKTVLLFFGYVREYKGLEHLLRAALLLDERFHLLVVGEFYVDRERYRHDLDALEAQGRLTLVDRYVPNEQIPLFFAAADVVVAPYLTATQSGVAQIAYGFGRPVIATTVGGLPEVVREGETGFLVPPADPEAIAAAARVFADGDRERFAAGIEGERARFSWDRMVETIESVVRDA